MTTIAQRTGMYQVSAKYAILYTDPTDEIGVNGVALRTAEGQVFFQAEMTGVWTQLVNLDNVQLNGDVALVAVQALKDGDVVRKASRTMQVA